RGRGRRASTRVGSSCGGFPWREGADGERVDAVARNVAERAVDEALALKPVLAGEGCTLDDDGEVRFAAAVVAGVAVVARAVVDHFEPGRGERLLQQGFDLSCDGSGHRCSPGVFMRADRKSTRLNYSHVKISYAVYYL